MKPFFKKLKKRLENKLEIIYSAKGRHSCILKKAFFLIGRQVIGSLKKENNLL
jgi:hypothetical protein